MNNTDVDEIVREIADRRNRLIQRLETSSAYEFNAVMHPSGVGGSGGGGGDKKVWEMIFSVQPWRRADGVIDHRELTVRKPDVSNEELNSAMENLKPYEVVRLHARVSDETQEADRWELPQALLITLCEKDVDDSELHMLAEDLQKTKCFKDPHLGRLQLDRKYGWIEGRRRLGFRRDKMYINLQKDGCYDSTMAYAKVLFVERNLEQVKQVIIDSLYETYSTCWESLGRLNQKQFIRRVKLKSLGVSIDGSITLYFTDGGLFHEHEIAVLIDRNERIGAANLAG